MTGDIVTRLRLWDDQQPPFRIMFEAADEIERLRAALALAVGELSTCGEYASMSPESLLTNFLKIADNQQLLVKEST